MSERFTVTFPDDVDEQLPYDDHHSKSATVVEYVERGFELASVEEERDAITAERDRLQEQVQELTQEQQELTERVEQLEEELADTKAECDNARAERDDYERRLREANRRRREMGELVEYVEGERDLQQKERMRQQAGVAQRMRWWLFGMDD